MKEMTNTVEGSDSVCPSHGKIKKPALGFEKFQLELQNRFALLETTGNVDEKTDTVVETLQDVSRRLFPGKRGNRESKLSPETLELMKKRREPQDVQMSSSDRRSSRACYGDDAISYVQVKRDGKFCTVKCKICPEHKVHVKLYRCTLVLNEEDEVIESVQCEDCLASQGGCKHAIAFLMWVHRRSEEPSCTSIECYWKKSKLSRVGSSLKYLTAKELSKGKPILPGDSAVLKKFLDEARKRKIEDCELLNVH
ncbi:hypothetical protein ACJJTC_006446 [Scirpophaga incertulas]